MINRIKLVAMTFFALPLAALAVFHTMPTKVTATALDDAPAVFKAKCAACHSPKAEKFYDPAAPMDEQVQAIMKGKKGEKPPYMPSFEAKGMTEEDAKALASYMKSLRTPAN